MASKKGEKSVVSVENPILDSLDLNSSDCIVLITKPKSGSHSGLVYPFLRIIVENLN